MRNEARIISALFLAMSLLFGCTPAWKPGPTRTGVYNESKTGPVAAALKEAELCLSKGEFNKAIEIYSDVYRRYPGNVTLRHSYLNAAEKIRNAAENAFQRNEFAEAGILFHLLKTDVVMKFGSEGLLSFSKRDVDDRISGCARVLTEEGLLSYRAGRLEAAIAAWKKVLLFDHENAEVKKAVETVQIQIETLEKVR